MTTIATARWTATTRTTTAMGQYDGDGDNGDGAMDDYDDGDDDNVDGDGAIDDNDDENDGDDNVVAQTPAHRRRRRHWQRVLSRGRGQGNKIIQWAG